MHWLKEINIRIVARVRNEATTSHGIVFRLFSASRISLVLLQMLAIRATKYVFE